MNRYRAIPAVLWVLDFGIFALLSERPAHLNKKRRLIEWNKWPKHYYSLEKYQNFNKNQIYHDFLLMKNLHRFKENTHDQSYFGPLCSFQKLSYPHIQVGLSRSCGLPCCSLVLDVLWNETEAGPRWGPG